MAKSSTSLSTVGNHGNHGNRTPSPSPAGYRGYRLMERTAIIGPSWGARSMARPHASTIGNVGNHGDQLSPNLGRLPRLPWLPSSETHRAIFREAAMRAEDPSGALSPGMPHPVRAVDPQVAVEFGPGLAGKTVGFDIETATAPPTTPLPVSTPAVSAIRLAQFFDHEDRWSTSSTADSAGTDWVRAPAGGASCGPQRLFRSQPPDELHDGPPVVRLHDAGRARVLYGENRSLKDLVTRTAGLRPVEGAAEERLGAEHTYRGPDRYAAADAVAALVSWGRLDEMMQGKYRDAYGLLKALRVSGGAPERNAPGHRCPRCSRSPLDNRDRGGSTRVGCCRIGQSELDQQKQQYLERVPADRGAGRLADNADWPAGN